MKEFINEIKSELEKIAGNVKGCEDFLRNLYDVEYPWQILDIIEKTLHKIEGNITEYEDKKRIWLDNQVYIGKGTIIKPNTIIEGPVVIGENCIIGPDTYIRPRTIIGNNCCIGHKTAVKNSIILSNTNAAHFNYIGDSIIGKYCNFGAGSKSEDSKITVTSNLRLDEKNIKVRYKGKEYETNRRKLGSIIEDNVKIGSGVILNPGTYIERDLWIYVKQQRIKTIRIDNKK